MMNVITGSSHYDQLSVVTSYRGISDYHSNKMVINTSAMKELYGDLNFQQIRFHCRKHSVGRTFHVVTAANSSGNAVVQYFSGLTDALPDSCGSYLRMEDDDSRLARLCSEWDFDQSGKWSYSMRKWNKAVERLYNHAAWIFSNIIGTLCKETLLSAMIFVEHPPLVIFGSIHLPFRRNVILNFIVRCFS